MHGGVGGIYLIVFFNGYVLFMRPLLDLVCLLYKTINYKSILKESNRILLMVVSHFRDSCMIY